MRACLGMVLTLGVGGCSLDARDLDAFRNTAAGPEKLRAVLHDPARPSTLRAEAALRLLDLERSDVDGRELLFSSLGSLPPAARRTLVPTLEQGLRARMATADGAVPSARAVRAKDSGVRLLPLLEPPQKAALGGSILRWVGHDLERRADAGEFSLEVISARVGVESARPATDSLKPQLSPKAFARLIESVDKYADSVTRSSAAAKIVAVEQAYRRTPQNDEVLNEFALPALGRFVDTAGARTRLVAIAADSSVALTQRQRALALVQGHVTQLDIPLLSKVVLDETAPHELRLSALARMGEPGAREALPTLLALVGARARALRQPATELAIAIGGERSLSDILNTLPQQWNINYARSEIEAYVVKVNTLPVTSTLTTMLGRKLYAYNWWPRVIGIRYLAQRAGIVEATWRLKLHVDEPKEIVGDEWPPHWTIGREASAALRALAAR